MAVVAVLLIVAGLLAVLRATLIVARGSVGRFRLDVPLSLIGGFALILAGQRLLQT